MKELPVLVILTRDQLELLANVKFSNDHISELADLVEIFAQKFLGPTAPDFMLDDAWRELWHKEPRQIEMDMPRTAPRCIWLRRWLWPRRT
jgi:hypothetical protein